MPQPNELHRRHRISQSSSLSSSNSPQLNELQRSRLSLHSSSSNSPQLNELQRLVDTVAFFLLCQLSHKMVHTKVLTSTVLLFQVRTRLALAWRLCRRLDSRLSSLYRPQQVSPLAHSVLLNRKRALGNVQFRNQNSYSSPSKQHSGH